MSSGVFLMAAGGEKTIKCSEINTWVILAVLYGSIKRVRKHEAGLSGCVIDVFGLLLLSGSW